MSIPPLPGKFIQTILEVHGIQGKTWLEGLPELISYCARRWSMTILPPFPLSYHYVAPAEDANGGQYVLKLGLPDPILANEISALRHFAGQGAARLEYGDLPIILAGFSFGAYVQARAAQRLHPQQLVLVAPAVGRFNMPLAPHNTLVIHGDEDEVVSLDAVLCWAHPQELPVIVLPGAGHFFHGRLNQIRQLVLDEFKEQEL